MGSFDFIKYQTYGVPLGTLFLLSIFYHLDDRENIGSLG
ncbi:hypothetical protein SR187_8455 [Streptococcus ruminantium]|uniref:Uncharacterized protein n=1 Tax=Streptococcus ruminantium TaxID=1917441 RepID=A0A2Z5TT16_9STRE|nr:hypothetical protein SR187_8455 [Streptococcus ruminantium]